MYSMSHPQQLWTTRSTWHVRLRRFLPYDMDSKSSKLSTELGLHFDETTQGWLKKEMREVSESVAGPGGAAMPGGSLCCLSFLPAV
jgi:hypothetical protein